MRDLKTRQKQSPFYTAWWFIMLMFLLSTFFLYASWKLIQKRKFLVHEHAKIEKRFRELREQNRSLKGKINLMQTEEGKMRFLKEYYGLGEKGERIIYLIEE